MNLIILLMQIVSNMVRRVLRIVVIILTFGELKIIDANF